MRAFVMQGFGASDQASAGTLAKPQCRPGDLLVRVAAAGVNPTDWKEMEGNLVNFYPPYESRWAPGFDGAGVVEVVLENAGQVRVTGSRSRQRPPRIFRPRHIFHGKRSSRHPDKAACK